MRDTLKGGTNSRSVHEGEHCLQTLIRLTQQVAFGTLKIRTSSITMDAHFVLNGTTENPIATAQSASS